MSDVLAAWRGEFGDEYLNRNPATPEVVTEAAEVFRRILDASGVRGEVESALEVGASVGINLHGLRALFGPGIPLAALEPNRTSCARLRHAPGLDLERVIEAEASRIPLPHETYDLVFTSGVLIHVPPAQLPGVMREICRVARRYVLCQEYFSHTPVELPYRGRDGMLWKRDFGKAYLEQCPDITVQGYGFIWQEEFPHFDNLNWWLFAKAGQPGR